MKYHQPFDQPTVPNASYQNANPALGLRGSILDILAVEYLQREFLKVVTDFGLTPTDSDLTQLWQAVRALYGVDTGAANAMVVALNPAPPALKPGMTVRVKKGSSANTGTTTLDIGLGANTVKRATGADLSSGDLPASTVAEFIWDGSYWQYANFQGFSATTTTTNNYSLSIPYAVDSGTANNLVASFSPAITSLAGGDMLKVKVANTVTGPTAIAINSMSPINVKRVDGTALRNGDVVAGQILILEFDGTNLQAVNLAPSSGFVPGTVHIWPTNTPPSGTLECNGTAVSRSTYARLFAILGTAYGVGDGTTTFNLPEYRGEFLRGQDHGRGVDPDVATRTNRGDTITGDNVGTRQSAAVGSFSATATFQNPQAAWASGNFGTANFAAGSLPMALDAGLTNPSPFTDLASPASSANALYNGVTATLTRELDYMGTTNYSGGYIGGLLVTSAAVKLSGISGSFSVTSTAVDTRPRNVSVLYVIAF